MTLAELEQLAAEMRPYVEDATGARMIVLPPIVVDDVASYNANLTAARRRWLTTLSFGFPESVPELTAAHSDEPMPPDTLMLYSPYDRAIHVMQDGGARVIAGDPMFDGHADELFACAMAHELVHAAQDQTVAQGEEPADGARAPRRVLVEGLATVYGLRACAAARGPGALPLAFAQQGIDSALARPREGWFTVYGVGAAYVAAVEAASGQDRAWSLVARPSPTVAELERRAATVLPGGWAAGEPLAPVAGHLGRSALTASPAEVIDEPHARAILDEAYVLAPGTRVGAMLYTLVRGPAGEGIVYAAELDRPATERPRATREGSHRVPALERLAGVTSAGWTESQGTQVLRVTAGSRVVRVQLPSGALSEPELTQLARDLVLALPEPAAAAWFAALAGSARSGPPRELGASWKWSYLDAALAREAGDAAGCRAALERSAAAAPADARADVAIMAGACEDRGEP